MSKAGTQIIEITKKQYDYSYIYYTYETGWYGNLGYKTFVRWNGKGFC